MRSSSIQLSPRSISFTSSAQLLDADGIKTSIATVAAAVAYSGADLDGAYANPGPAIPTPNSHTGVAQWPIAVSAANAGSYVLASTVSFVGTYGGEVTTRTATVGDADGGETLFADGPLETVTSVEIEAQADTSGAWTFGFTDLAPRKVQGSIEQPAFRGVVGGASGDVAVQYAGGAYADVLPCEASQQWLVTPTRIVQATTDIAFTVLE